MGLGMTVVLGLIAGGTILVGVPVGRLRRPGAGLTVVLNASAIGVLVFLLWDVLSAGWAPTDAALVATHTESASFAPAAGYGFLFLAGIGVGLLTLVEYERWMRRAVSGTSPAGVAAQVPSARVRVDAVGRPSAGIGPEASHRLAAPAAGVAGWSAPRRLALLVAVGIGVHNF